MKTTTFAPAGRLAIARRQALPYPRSGSVTTVAPHPRAISAVRSRDPLSATIMSEYSPGGIRPSVVAIAGSSLRAGMIRTAFGTRGPFIGIIEFHGYLRGE